MMATDRTITRNALKSLQQEIGGKIVGNRLLPIGAALGALCERDRPEPEFREAFVVQTALKQENMASGGLVGKGLPSYCPEEPRSVRQNYFKRRLVWRPMFSSYIFTSFDPETDEWKKVYSVPGVVRLLMFGSHPICVPEPCMQRIRHREACAKEKAERKLVAITCQVGDWVQIIEHPTFTGFFGRVIELIEHKQRISVEVEVFRRQTPVEVSVNQVRVV